jgi:hypothetical protein
VLELFFLSTNIASFQNYLTTAAVLPLQACCFRAVRRGNHPLLGACFREVVSTSLRKRESAEVTHIPFGGASLPWQGLYGGRCTVAIETSDITSSGRRVKSRNLKMVPGRLQSCFQFYSTSPLIFLLHFSWARQVTCRCCRLPRGCQS